jgi:predicted transcriptional regulator
MNIAQLLKKRRQELGITQHDLAIHCNFANRANISKLEAGKLEWKMRDVLAACKMLELELIIKERSE